LVVGRGPFMVRQAHHKRSKGWLHVEPNLRRCVEGLGQSQRQFYGHGGALVHKLGNRFPRHGDSLAARVPSRDCRIRAPCRKARSFAMTNLGQISASCTAASRWPPDGSVVVSS
jgi:hypothetical protein